MSRITVTPTLFRQIKASIDWIRARGMTDAQIAQGIANDPNAAPPLTEAEGRVLRLQILRKRRRAI